MKDKWQAVQAIARGALSALRDPRRLARLNIVSASDLEQHYEMEARRYLGGVPRSVPIERVIQLDRARLEAFSFLDDTSTVLDLLLLRGLAAQLERARYLEIGTFRGESALAVASVGAEVVTVSLSDDELRVRGAEESWIQAHRTFSQGHPSIRHLQGDSQLVDLSDFQGWADVIFVDGDHGREAVEADTRRYWTVKAPHTGVIVWHDAFWSPLRPRWEVVAGIAAGIPPTERDRLVHVSNTLCLAWLPTAAGLPTVEWSYVPRVAFSVGVELLKAEEPFVAPASSSARSRSEAPSSLAGPPEL